MKTIEQAIAKAIESTPERTKARNQALASVKWRLVTPLGLCAGLSNHFPFEEILVVPEDPRALVFDGRDNEQAKLQWFKLATGQNLEIQLCES